MSLTKDEITSLAMRDAETESMEGLEAAAGIYDRLVAQQDDNNPNSQTNNTQVNHLDE